MEQPTTIIRTEDASGANTGHIVIVIAILVGAIVWYVLAHNKAQPITTIDQSQPGTQVNVQLPPDTTNGGATVTNTTTNPATGTVQTTTNTQTVPGNTTPPVDIPQSGS